MAEVFREDFDTLADGTLVTAANTAFDTNSGDGIIEADTAFSVTGGVSCAFICAAATENVRLDDTFTATGSRWFRWYFRPPDPLTLANRPRLVALFSVSTHQAGLLLENNGTLTIINGSSAVGTTTTAVTPGEWHRLEWGVVNGGNNELRLFVGANVHGTVPDDTVSAAYSEGTFDSFSIGPWVARDAWTHHVDSVVADDAAFPGQELPNPINRVQQAFNSEAEGVTDVHSATLTSAPTEGNLLVAVVAARGGADDWTDPPGWARVIDEDISGGNLACWTRTAGASEPATFSVTYSSAARAWCVWLVELTGQDDIPLDLTAHAAFASATSATLTTSPTSTSFADEYSIAFVAVREGNSTGFAWTNSFFAEAEIVAPGTNAIVLATSSKSPVPTGVVATDASWTNANAGGWGLLTVKPVVNDPPTADAGPDQTVQEGVLVALDGTGSTDPEDGQAGLDYEWTVSNGGGTGLTDADITNRLTDTASFTAPDVAVQSAIVLQLQVTDTGGLSDTDTVTITVSPLAFPQVPLDVHVELKLGGVWTDITSLVYTRDAITIKRGRSDEASRVDPGTLTMTLNNRDGRFSPRNPTGALFGLIGRNTPVRVYIVHNGQRFDRFAGEISEWPVRWEPGGTDVYVQVEAAGILRRITQGAGPTGSAMRRHLTSPDIASPPVAYWPLEDGRDAGAFASGLTSGRPMTITGDLDLAGDDSFVASEALPRMKAAVAKGRVPRYDDTGSTQVLFLLSVPEDNETLGADVIGVDTTGTFKRWELQLFGDGDVQLFLLDADSNVQSTGTRFAAGLNGNPALVSLTFTQDGGSIDFGVAVWKVGAVAGAEALDSIAGTLGRVERVTVNTDAANPLNDVALGHISVHGRFTPIVELGMGPLQGHTGETPLARVTRLCTEEGIAVQTVGAGDAPWLGPQFPATLAELLEEAAESASGILYEPRDELAVGFRARGSIYNQAADATLDYAAKQVAPPLEPVDDDQNTRNDVTVSNQDGTSARFVQTDGPLSVAGPPVGVGRYNEDVTVSADHGEFLPHMAGWRVRLGTVDEARYPMVTVDFALPAISSDTALTEALLALDSGDRLVIDNPPEWLPPEDISLIVQGYEETLANFEHRVTFNCSPESPWRVAELDQTGNTASRYGPSNSFLEGSGAGGDFPQVADFATSSGGGSQHAVSIPPHAAGDIIVLYYYSTAAPNEPPSDLGGVSWVLLESGGFSDGGRVWWLRANNSDGSSVTVTPVISTSFASIAVRVTGADSATDVEAASANSADPPVLNPAAWDVENTLWLASYTDSSGDITDVPAGYTLVDSEDAAVVVAVARRDAAVASEDPGAWTATGGLGPHAATVAVRPAAPPPPEESTSLSVATASGPLWVTHLEQPGEFPLDIMVGGERMTVTDIDFTSSPQVFTVQRSVNGVVKSHPTGTQVELFAPAHRAL